MQEGQELDKKKFRYVGGERKQSEQQLVGEPIGYFKDAWLRFSKNKASLVALGIIASLALFSLFAPLFSPYTVAYQDEYYNIVSKQNTFEQRTFEHIYITT